MLDHQKFNIFGHWKYNMLNFMTMAFDGLHNKELLLLGFMFVFGLFVFVFVLFFFISFI